MDIFKHPVTTPTHTPINTLAHKITTSCSSFLITDSKKAQFCHTAINELMFYTTALFVLTFFLIQLQLS